MWFVLELGTVIEVIGVTLCLAGGPPNFYPRVTFRDPPRGRKGVSEVERETVGVCNRGRRIEWRTQISEKINFFIP